MKMADLQKTIDIVLSGHDRASQALDGASTSMQKLGKSMRGLGKVGVAAAAGIAAVSTAVTGLVAAGLKEAYDQSVKFETAMTDLEKVLGSQPEQLDRAQQAAMDLSSTYEVAAAEVTDSIAGWVQAGYDLNESVVLAEESIALMYASEMDAATATESLTKIMKGFGLEVGEARSKLDAINEISNNYAASSTQLSEALGRVAPAADKMGFSLEEIAAVMTPAIEKFQDGEKVGTAFKTILANMAAPTGKVKEGLEQLGVYQGIVNNEFSSGKEVFDAVAQAFGQLDEQQQATIATQIAGKEHFTKFLAAMGNAEESAGAYEAAMNSVGSITEEVARQLESSENILKVHQESWNNLAGAIGKKYNESVDEVIKGSSLISAALRDSVKEGDFDPIFNIQHTRYTGRDMLYGRIQGHLSQPGREKELVAWFAYWVYRRLINYRETEIEIDDYRIFEVSDELANDQRVLKSIRRYEGIDFAGEREFSTQTIAYQEVSERIRDKFGIPKPDTTRKPKARKDSSTGCLASFFLLVVIFVFFVATIVWAGKYIFGL